MIKGLLNQTISVATKTGFDTFGRETVGTPTDYQCRFQKETIQRLAPNGVVIVILAVVYVAEDAEIEINDKVTFDSVDYKVHGKYQSVDGAGNTHHFKLELIKWE